ncbi:hypothetical protein [Tenacibaculum aiptasiae]|uniref:hypothetical protein n=1 Tax=Tenacibaculum aiptasiae TaxID=426481 RepID=UPI00232D09FF|nr:hypothetical protein [Tenacibaculum aiptasiae]
MKKNKNVSYGNNTTNIVKAKKVKIQYQNNNNVLISDYEKKKIKEIKIKPKKLTLIGAFGFGATLLTYISMFIKFPIFKMSEYFIYIPLLSFIFMITLAVGQVLNRRKFIPLLRNYIIETNDESIYLKKLIIKCPNCKSKMNILQDDHGVFIKCLRNPELHFYKFDYTTLDND